MSVFGRFLQNSNPVIKLIIAILINSVVGHKLFYVAGDSENRPPKGVADVTAQVIVDNPPGEISNGYTLVLDCHTDDIACKLSEIKEINRGTGNSTEGNPKFVKSGDSEAVSLVPPPPQLVEAIQDFPPLGQTVAVDVKSVNFKEADGSKVKSTKNKK